MYDTKVHGQKEQKMECQEEEKNMFVDVFWLEWVDRQLKCSIISLRPFSKLSSENNPKFTGQSAHDLIIIYASCLESYGT